MCRRCVTCDVSQHTPPHRRAGWTFIEKIQASGEFIRKRADTSEVKIVEIFSPEWHSVPDVKTATPWNFMGIDVVQIKER